MTARILNILLLCGAIVGAYAKSQSTPEGFALKRLRTAIDLYRENNLGQLPTSWSDLDARYVDLLSINEILLGKGVGPIQQNYVFVPQRGLVDKRGRHVLVVRTAPLQDPDHPEPGRYMIVLECADPFGVVSTNCGPTVHWVKEPEVKKMLEMADIQLPRPDYQAVEAAKTAIREKKLQMQEATRQAEFTGLKLIFLDKLLRIKSWFIAPASTNQSVDASRSAGSRIKAGPTAILGIVAISSLISGAWYWKGRK